MRILESLFAVSGTNGTRRWTVDQDERGRSATVSTLESASHQSQATESGTGRARIRDKVDVSKKVEVFSTALEVARNSPEIRASLVEEMRVLVTTGKIGRDVHRLANRLIDSVDELATDQLRASKPSYARPASRY